jgi:uncharacterized protein (DUF488 family)
MEFYTIGVYNSTEQEFLNKLTQNKIDTFCDIRQRRGVRGATYSFVNSIKLQQKLNDLGIKYFYVEALAPTAEIREVQTKIDKKKGVQQRIRQELDRSFILEYENKVLEKFNFENFIDHLEKARSKKIAFFCVEENHEACHRSLVTNKLKTKFNSKIKHL